MSLTETRVGVAPDIDAVLDAARAGASRAEAERRCTPELVEAAKQSGLFCMALPRRLGGLGLPPADIADALERVAHADGAAGWCAFIGNSTSFVGWLDPVAATTNSAGAPNVAAASIFSPTGRATPDGRGSYRVEGRWPFASGCLHSEHVQVGVMVCDDEGPRQRADGLPDWRFAYLPASAVEVLDTWDTLGLRGTGSNDIAVTGVTIEPEQLAMPMWDPPRLDDPVYQLGFWPLLNVLMTPFALGVARRALDELCASLKVDAPPGPRPGRDDVEVQHTVGRATARLLGARALLDDAIGRAWQKVERGDSLAAAEAERLSLAMHHGIREAVSIVDEAFDCAGSAVIRSGNVLGRCFRDLQTARKHVVFSPEGYRLAGKRATT